MMRLPRSLSGAEVVRALQRASFYRRRQRGGHVVMRRDDPFAQVVVPVDEKRISSHPFRMS